MEELNTEILDCLGKRVKVKYLGTGRFEKFVMTNGSDNVIYYLERDISILPSSEDHKIIRREYFNNEMRRKYVGWRNSFIEFCREMEKFNQLPTREKVFEIARHLRLSRKVAKLYVWYYRKFFNQREEKMNPKNFYGGVRRVQCLECQGYFDLCPENYNQNCVCPHCGQYFVGYKRGQDLAIIKEVPWWYGKKIPSWLEVKWGENHGYSSQFALIPHFYLDVYIHLAKEKGQATNRGEAILFFANHAKKHWGREIWLVSNEEWERLRVNSLHIF